MQLVYGNFWEYEADYHVITTNGIVRKDGACVMGRGVAAEAKERYPDLPYVLGERIRVVGNVVHDLGAWRRMGDERECHLWSFPVKHHWADEADLELVEKSAIALAGLAGMTTKTFVLVRPGVGNGRRHWAEVEPLLACLPDNVHVITYASGGE